MQFGEGSPRPNGRDLSPSLNPGLAFLIGAVGPCGYLTTAAFFVGGFAFLTLTLGINWALRPSREAAVFFA